MVGAAISGQPKSVACGEKTLKRFGHLFGKTRPAITVATITASFTLEKSLSMSSLSNARLPSTTAPPVNVADASGAATHSGAPKTAKLQPELAAAARRHARRLDRQFGSLFLAVPKLKERYAAAIRKELPPRARPRSTAT